MGKNITTYLVEGLNFRKFLSKLKDNEIEIYNLARQNYNKFTVGVDSKNIRYFLNLAQQFNYKVEEFKISKNKKFWRLFKQNFAFSLIVIIILSSLFFARNFVFKVEVDGLSSVTKEEVISVLNKNGFKMGKLKNAYDLDSIQKVLTTNIDKISFASGVIKGNTLLITLNEKIDNSPYIYDYAPIFAPCDCVIKSVELTSGTQLVFQNQTVKSGQMIVSPVLVYENKIKIPVPAKAKITAYVELTTFSECDRGSYEKSKEKIIELNRKKLYTNFVNNLKANNLEEIVSTEESDGKIIVKTLLKGEITF